MLQRRHDKLAHRWLVVLLQVGRALRAGIRAYDYESGRQNLFGGVCTMTRPKPIAVVAMVLIFVFAYVSIAVALGIIEALRAVARLLFGSAL